MDADIPGFALRVRPSGTMTYLLFYRNKDGAKRTYTIGQGLTAVQARDIAQKVRGEVLQGIDVNERNKQRRLSKQKDKENKLSSFLNKVYAPWLLQNRRNGKADIKSLETNFAGFMSRNLTDITKWDIQRWRMDKKKGELSDHSIERYLAELRALLNKAVEWERIAYNPIAGLSKPKAEDNKRVRYLSDAERKRLLWALDDREQEIVSGRESGNRWRKERGYELFQDLSTQTYADYLKPMVLIALNTGMRRGELFQVT
ncbi:MAG: integrase, partial [Gammaproteobacteria bacterium]